jgi:predicted LPLAT superfamily acyltransferase
VTETAGGDLLLGQLLGDSLDVCRALATVPAIPP